MIQLQQKVIKKNLFDLSDMPPWECAEEEVKEGKKIENFSSKQIARLPIVLAEKRNKEKSDKYYIFLYQHSKITIKVYNNLIKSLQSWKKILLW